MTTPTARQPWKWPIVVVLLWAACVSMLAPHTNAQDECSGPDSITVEFMEVGPGQEFNPNSTEYIIQILKGSPEEFLVTSVDGDQSPILFDDYFRVIGGLDSSGIFLQLYRRIDIASMGTTNVLQYQIRCVSTRGTPAIFKVLRVSILPQNYFTPRFALSAYATEIRESAPVGTSVMQLAAFDGDAYSPSNEVLFRIIKAPDSLLDGTPFFNISPVSGTITLVKQVDFDYNWWLLKNNRVNSVAFQFTAIVTDLGTPPRTSTALVSVIIVDVNDLGPSLDHPSCNEDGIAGVACNGPLYTATLPNQVDTEVVLYPEPPDDNISKGIVMYDRDSLGSPIDCRISDISSPPGYNVFFETLSERWDNDKRYKCTVIQKEIFDYPLAKDIELGIMVFETLLDGGDRNPETIDVNVVILPPGEATTPSISSGTQAPRCPRQEGFMYPDEGDCQTYFTCEYGVYTKHQCREGKMFSPLVGACVAFNSFLDTCSRYNPASSCTAYGMDGNSKIPHPFACSAFYECDSTFGDVPYREGSCGPLSLFDVFDRKCIPTDEAFCGFGRSSLSGLA